MDLGGTNVTAGFSAPKAVKYHPIISIGMTI
jgi:hypothetical protein